MTVQSSLLGGTNTSASSNTGAITAAAGGSTQDLFTTLLVAQIKNQNPLEPNDPSEFVSQLTQLSQTEALQSLVSQNASNAGMLDSLQVLSLGAQVGSEVWARTESVTLGSEPVRGALTLTSPSTQTTLVLKDPAGTERRIELGSRPKGEVSFSIDPAELGLPAGTYSVAVETSTKETPAIEVAGTLQSVRLSAAGGVALSITGLGETAPTAITRFNGRTAS